MRTTVSLWGPTLAAQMGLSILPQRHRPVRFEFSECLERAAGIEPASLAWKAKVLPLHNARSVGRGYDKPEGGVKGEELGLG